MWRWDLQKRSIHVWNASHLECVFVVGEDVKGGVEWKSETLAAGDLGRHVMH